MNSTRSSLLDRFRRPAQARPTMPVAVALVVALAVGGAVWLLAGTAPDLARRHLVVGGVPLDEVHPAGPETGERRPGVVLAHGYAGSARLMAPFGDTLAAQGYVVVLLDFTGHGANTRPLPDGSVSADDSTTALQRDLDVAMTHLRALPDVDPSRTALVGHSMGAGAVTRYAVAHPEVTATAAISLPDASLIRPDRPRRLLLLVGGLEFAGFRDAAESGVPAGSTDRATVVVPGVEHISVLYAPRTHREIVTWLNHSFQRPSGTGALPSPLRRPAGAAVLMLALLVGLYPLAHLVLGGGFGRRPTQAPVSLRRVGGVTAVATVVGMIVAPILPTVRLPLAVGGFLVGFTTVTGVVLLAHRRRQLRAVPSGPEHSATVVAPPTPPGGRRLVVAALLIGYAGVTIALPLQLGLTQAIPVGVRWWLLVCVWAGLAVLAYAAEQVTGGNSLALLVVAGVVVLALTVAAIAGLTSGFVLLVVPLLAVLMVFQTAWSALLHRFCAPIELIALVGSLLVAWPIAIALPVIG